LSSWSLSSSSGNSLPPLSSSSSSSTLCPAAGGGLLSHGLLRRGGGLGGPSLALLLWLNAPKRLICPVSASASVAARSFALFTWKMRTELRWRFFLLPESTMT
jgi:hypothetical protein